MVDHIEFSVQDSIEHGDSFKSLILRLSQITRRQQERLGLARLENPRRASFDCAISVASNFDDAR